MATAEKTILSISNVSRLVTNLHKAREFISGKSESLRKDDYTLQERVRLYAEINPINKEIGKIRKTFRDAIVTEVKERCAEDEATARLSVVETEDGLLSQNEKGSIFLREGDFALELRVSSREQFNEEAAREVLAEKGLLSLVEETSQAVSDVDALREAVEFVLSHLDDQEGDAGANLAYATLSDAWNSAVTATSSLSEEKITDLVKEGRLKPADIARMFQTRFDYKLYGD